jgi:tRNA threonylcarbamoyladenosine biosynthesis protein TsaB
MVRAVGRPPTRPGRLAVGTVILLAVESATDTVGAAVARDGGGEAERIHVGGRAHAEQLAPTIAEACALAGCALTDIDRIAVDVGPGLFTGLRVGVATAKALAQALGVTVLGVGSLDILAVAARERLGGPPDGPVAAVVDARRGEVFAAAYHFEGRADLPDPAAVRDDRPEPMAPAALEAWLSGLARGGGRVTVVGDGARRYREQLSAHGSLDLALVDELAAPPPLAQARLARRRLAAGATPSAPADLVPDYRRAADARINWEQRTPPVRDARVGGGREGPAR